MKKIILIIIGVIIIGAGIFCAIFFLKKFDVTFYSNDGTILKTEQVRRYASVTPPTEDPIQDYGDVFLGWDKDFSSVTEDLDVHAVCESFKGKKNVIALSSGYAKTGETVSVPIQLCGDVSIAAFDVCITYDSDLLKFEGTTDDDGGIVINEGEIGCIYLNYVSLENTTGDVDLCTLNFTSIGEADETEAKLEINVTSAFEIVDNELTETECNVINSSIYKIN